MKKSLAGVGCSGSWGIDRSRLRGKVSYPRKESSSNHVLPVWGRLRLFYLLLYPHTTLASYIMLQTAGRESSRRDIEVVKVRGAGEDLTTARREKASTDRRRSIEVGAIWGVELGNRVMGVLYEV